MASDIIAPGADEPRDERPKGPPPVVERSAGGFFTIYKKGQGKWTRLGTVAGAVLLALLTAHFLYDQLRTMTAFQYLGRPRVGLLLGVIGGLLAVYSLVIFWLINKPSNADFLIATDSEMKKVNWTSKNELIGSTKVVISFMFIIAALLFLFDVIFGYFFYLIGVLKSKPF